MSQNVLKTALISPKIKVANVTYNVDEIIRSSHQAAENNSKLIIFPELTVTGATCGDLFFHDRLYNSNIEGIKKIIYHSQKLDSLIIFGACLKIEGCLFDCIFITKNGKILGIVPKIFPSSGINDGICQSRWFSDGKRFRDIDEIKTEITNYPIQIGGNFKLGGYYPEFTVVNGSDIFHRSEDTAAGRHHASVVINPTADSTLAELNSHRLKYYAEMSEENICTYVYVSPGVYESTTDLVFPGYSFIVSNGDVLSESTAFVRDTNITYSHIDSFVVPRINNHASKDFSYDIFMDRLKADNSNPAPFIPDDRTRIDKLCADAFAIQATALASRFEHTQCEKALLGVSGGLDSTLALLVAAEAFRLMGKGTDDIITVTMPGLGTSDKTYTNALMLMDILSTDQREIPIIDSVKLHFKDIGHDISVKNNAYENAQARERTQILLDMANDVRGLAIGTGDLSEAALGWCTFGGDHLAMYGVNGSVPKTLIPYILRWVSDNKKNLTTQPEMLQKILTSIIETPISPELLPADRDGEISQKTEDSIGPYELHDFFIYHTILGKISPLQLVKMATSAFKGKYTEEMVSKWIKVFYSRFFSQQFKRNCSIDGPMVTLISFSPRGGLVLPSDADPNEWIDTLSGIK